MKELRVIYSVQPEKSLPDLTEQIITAVINVFQLLRLYLTWTDAVSYLLVLLNHPNVTLQEALEQTLLGSVTLSINKCLSI